MSAPLRWGIIGPGRIAPRIVRAVAAEPRAELRAVAGRDRARAAMFARTHAIPQVYESYDAILAASDIDVVYIALPNALHVPWTERALGAGKHVLCEKPLALDAEGVDRIAAAATRAGRIAAEAFMFLHHPQIIRAVELARDGSLGPLELVNGSFSFLLTHADDPRVDPAMGGGSLWDVGCYPVNLALRVAGEEPEAVQAIARFDENGVDRTFVGQLRFAGGLLAQFDSGFAAPDRERIEIVGRDATLVLATPFLPEPEGPPPSLVLRRGGQDTVVPVDSVDQYAAEVADLTAAILDGTTPRVELSFSRATISTLARLDAAARQRSRDEGAAGR